MERRGFLAALAGLPLVRGLMSQPERQAAPVLFAKETTFGTEPADPKPFQITTIVEVGGVEIERIEREFYSRALRDVRGPVDPNFRYLR